MVMKILLGGLGGCVLLALMAWVRLAPPSDPARFHTTVTPVPKRMSGGGVIEVIAGGDAETLLALDSIARATPPRTKLFAGAPSAGHVTYITRSRFWGGFPDFTTLQRHGDQIAIHARLRFGKSDMGVNSARVADWLERLKPVEQ